MEWIKPNGNENYLDYINRILQERENKKDQNYYQERHHIIPKSCGGSNDDNNLIYLYPQEHLFAHKLLHEENPENKSLNYAYWMMLNTAKQKQEEVVLEDLANSYQEMRETFINMNSGENHYLYGKKLSEDFNKKIHEAREYKKGEDNPWYGRHHSEETKQKISETKKGKSNPNSVKALEKYRKENGGAFSNHKHSEKSLKENKRKHNRPVVCIETGEIFESVLVAAKSKRLKSPSGIFNVCNGRAHHSRIGINGEFLSWRYATKEDFLEGELPYYFIKEKGCD